MLVEVTRHINATPEQVWAVITDIERWPEWTASVTSVKRLDEGELRVGSQARIKQPHIPTSVWTVSELDPGHAFTWQAGFFGGTISGGHYIDAVEEGGTNVRLVIEARGGLTGIMSGWIERTSRKNMNTEADGLKRQSEALAALAA